MNPPSRTRDALARVRPLLHWRVLAPVLGGALAPKCLLCAAGYIAGGAALFGVQPEICGAPTGTNMASVLPAFAGAAFGAAFGAWRHRRRHRP